jgi:E3 ubiquitin-protein ligase MYCBP2
MMTQSTHYLFCEAHVVKGTVMTALPSMLIGFLLPCCVMCSCVRCPGAGVWQLLCTSSRKQLPFTRHRVCRLEVQVSDLAATLLQAQLYLVCGIHAVYIDCWPALLGLLPRDLTASVCCCISACYGCGKPRHDVLVLLPSPDRYCCNMASWFCWGSTHMCSRCHDNPSQRHGHRCPGMGRCMLTVPHPPPGESICLGCEACRHRDG